MADVRVDGSHAAEPARKSSLTVLDDVRVASPCHADWKGMIGDDRSRHCLECDRRVYDLSALTAEQALALIREKESDLCIRLYRRTDGRILTADCPVGLRAKLMHAGRRVGAGAWLLVCVACGLLACVVYGLTQGHVRGLAGQIVPAAEPPLMGKIDCRPQQQEEPNPPQNDPRPQRGDKEPAPFVPDPR
jgi:hypothetical protein